MWFGGQDTNQDGDPILLLKPKLRPSKSPAKSPSSSHIGGLPVFHEADAEMEYSFENPHCEKCRQIMPLLIQLHAPLDELDRTLYVFGCNRLSCHTFESGDINEGGGGVGHENSRGKFRPCFGGISGSNSIRCLRSQKVWQESIGKVTSENYNIDDEKPTKSNLDDNDWGDDGSDGWGKDCNDDGDWGAGADTTNEVDVSIDDLEAMISKCEMQTNASCNKPPKSSFAKKDQCANVLQSTKVRIPAFPMYELEMINEPPSTNQSNRFDGDDDDDDNDESCDNIDVNNLLSRYMAMEDDEEILSALKGGAKNYSGQSNGGSGGGEKYERLPAHERAFLAFSSRVKRAPRQVARYAYGGVPLWSRPLPSNKHFNHSRGGKLQKTKNTPNSLFPQILPCNCGAQRLFEFQLLPSMLHVLDVDSNANLNDKNLDVMDLVSRGGMNWGAVAVYSCPESCDLSREEFVVVQASLDDDPVVPKIGMNGDEDSHVDDDDGDIADHDSDS
mmetsp:Transcript_20386/g.42755  ORF Transcript_20386/g.42755 Transcript_20386/m.42755 type:complete len:501 (-) Transcript_20386:114-1616(-)